MKNLVGLLAALILLSAMVQLGTAQDSSGSDNKTVAAITQIEHDWETAMHNKDDAAVAKIMADGWVGLNPDGSLEAKSQFLSEVKRGDYANVKLENVEVRSFGNTAAAMGKASDPKMGNVVYMDVFMRHGGSWKAIASSIGPLQAAH